MTFPRSLAPAALVVLAFLLIYVPIYLPRAQAQANSVSTDLNLTFTTIDVPRGPTFWGPWGKPSSSRILPIIIGWRNT